MCALIQEVRIAKALFTTFYNIVNVPVYDTLSNMMDPSEQI
jgi:hypothetical protein